MLDFSVNTTWATRHGCVGAAHSPSSETRATGSKLVVFRLLPNPQVTVDSPPTQSHLRRPSCKDTNSAPRVERLVQPKELPDAETGSASQIPAVSVSCNSQSRPSAKPALGRKTQTLQHILGSKSNYQVLQSGKPLPSNHSFHSSLQACVGKKRAQR